MPEEITIATKIMIIGVVFVFLFHLIAYVVTQAPTSSGTPITLPYWAALVIDLVAIGVYAVIGVFAHD